MLGKKIVTDLSLNNTVWLIVMTVIFQTNVSWKWGAEGKSEGESEGCYFISQRYTNCL